ncbi:MAG: TIGR01244 family phosphatase [Robiginitomaculum sp.]|nr:MAG: TIGR01244 family phosphatase [Robiginitomaculum sp.]
MKILNLTETYSVSPQVRAKDMSALAEAGFTAVINNRPDGEMWGQPKGAEIEAAAEAAGLAYFNIPISLRGLDPAQIEQLKKAQSKTKGKILAYCNTGTRAANVWGLSQAGMLSAEQIIAAGTQAGFNLNGLRPYLGG